MGRLLAKDTEHVQRPRGEKKTANSNNCRMLRFRSRELQAVERTTKERGREVSLGRAIPGPCVRFSVMLRVMGSHGRF